MRVGFPSVESPFFREVRTQALSGGGKKFWTCFGDRHEFPEGSPVVLELDEIRHYVKKNPKIMDMEGFPSRQRASCRLGM